MKILHLNAYYIDNHLYSQLYSTLDAELEQRVYIPIKTDRKPENEVDLNQGELIFEKVIKPNHKYNYFRKIKEITNALIQKKAHQDVDFIHAHNLFTDGVVAYNLKKKFGLKYIVAVRTTDIALQYKYMYHRRFKAKKVLEEAEQVIFISPTYRDKLFQMMSDAFISKISPKVKIMPNGINDFWLENLQNPSGKSLDKRVNLLYVGQIMQRKNVLPLIQALEKLNETTDKEYHLTVVGGENQYEKEFYNSFLNEIKPYDWVDYKGKIKDKEKLLQAYRHADIFAMPAKGELFGLVYIEALSQGKPVLYASGEGIDGFLEGKGVGVSVNPDNLEEICNGITQMVNNYKTYRDFSQIVKPFNWNSIANLYKTMYQHNEQD
ncbi:glycosyltransferase family 4 protein [Flagellimonas sp.]|uniref:glycosyltransferase family 4 protein n=1 Tax=Flagellimonas sp. TaxID=2058762 RepID=UPI003B52FA0F